MAVETPSRQQQWRWLGDFCSRRLLLSFCQEPLLIDGIRCEPLEGWLRQLRP